MSKEISSITFNTDKAVMQAATKLMLKVQKLNGTIPVLAAGSAAGGLPRLLPRFHKRRRARIEGQNSMFVTTGDGSITSNNLKMMFDNCETRISLSYDEYGHLCDEIVDTLAPHVANVDVWLATQEQIEAKVKQAEDAAYNAERSGYDALSEQQRAACRKQHAARARKQAADELRYSPNMIENIAHSLYAIQQSGLLELHEAIREAYALSRAEKIARSFQIDAHQWLSWAGVPYTKVTQPDVGVNTPAHQAFLAAHPTPLGGSVNAKQLLATITGKTNEGEKEDSHED